MTAGGTVALAPDPWVPPPDPWCTRRCPGTRTATYGEPGSVVRHVHSACWQCGTPVTSESVSYTCEVCDCKGRHQVPAPLTRSPG